MKKLLLLGLLISIVACNNAPKDYATLSGKITNKNSDSLVIRNRSYSKTIKVNEDGTFKDTLKVTSGIYNLFDGKESTSIFLENDTDIKLTLDTNEFDETITYTGKGSETSNYLAKKSLFSEKNFSPALFDLNEAEFKTKLAKLKQDFNVLLENNKDIDSTIYANDKQSIDKMEEGLLGAYERQKARASKYAALIGKPSPNFKDYENYKGGTTSLSDLKGKYVYVDVWATWCGPCKAEIPALKRVESKYHGKNIEFVSISVDDGRGFKADSKEASLAASKEGWKKMIAEKEMGGVQLFSNGGWASEFIQGYNINGIPRFILIDPAGNVVNPDAPRPSSPKLIELFDSLKI